MIYDINGMRFCQGSIALLLLVSHFLNLIPLVILVMLVMLAGAVLGVEKAGLFYLGYVKLLRPLFKLPSLERERDPFELRFAQGLGGAFLVAAVIFYYLGWQGMAWMVVLLVAALSFLGALGLCAGAIIYAAIKRILKRG